MQSILILDINNCILILDVTTFSNFTDTCEMKNSSSTLSSCSLSMIPCNVFQFICVQMQITGVNDVIQSFGARSILLLNKLDLFLSY